MSLKGIKHTYACYQAIHHLGSNWHEGSFQEQWRHSIIQCRQRTISFLAKAWLHLYKSRNSDGSVVQRQNCLAIGVLSLLDMLSTISQLQHQLCSCTMGNFALGRCVETKYSTWLCLMLYLPLDPSLIQYFP